MTDPTVVDRLEPGDHLCWTFDDDHHQMETVARFVRAGVRSDHKILCFTDALPAGTLLEGIRDLGVNIDAPLREGQLRVSRAADSYLAAGAFDAEATLDGWGRLIDEARAEGYAGLRVAADMSWGSQPTVDQDGLARYEARANRIFAEGYAVALCCYDRRLFPSGTLDRVAAAHPATAGQRTGRTPWGTAQEWEPLLRLRIRADSPTVVVTGELDLSNRRALITTVTSLSDRAGPGTPVTVDLSGVRFMDTGTMHQLVRAAGSSSTRLRLVGCPPLLERLIRLVGFDRTEGLEITGGPEIVDGAVDR